MKKINLNLTATNDKRVIVIGKLYFGEKVECVIRGTSALSSSTIRTAIFDDNTPVAVGTNFSDYESNSGSVYCEFSLKTEELQDALSDISPNKRKNFTVYVWDGYEEEMVCVGTLPIYNNPYTDDIIIESTISPKREEISFVSTDISDNTYIVKDAMIGDFVVIDNDNELVITGQKQVGSDVVINLFGFDISSPWRIRFI